MSVWTTLNLVAEYMMFSNPSLGMYRAIHRYRVISLLSEVLQVALGQILQDPGCFGWSPPGYSVCLTSIGSKATIAVTRLNSSQAALANYINWQLLDIHQVSNRQQLKPFSNGLIGAHCIFLARVLSASWMT